MFDPLDLNEDGIVDEDEAFVSDGTGLHPTRTTYASTVIMTSPEYGEETTVPTPDSYHVVNSRQELLLYNIHVGNELSFNDEAIPNVWGAYGPRPDYVGRKWAGGKDMTDIWVDGFTPKHSWDWLSPVTGNQYVNLCPTIIFFENGNLFANPKTKYYFFVEVFNDFQAYHGFANYSMKRDGLPAVDWPGMIEVKHAIGTESQRPKARSFYESWFDSKYGAGFDYAAPYMYKVEHISTNLPPTRHRTLSGDESSIGTRDPEVESEQAPLPASLPAFGNNQYVQFNAGHTVQINKSTAGLGYAQKWLRAFSGMDQNSNVVQGTLVDGQLDAQQQSGLRVTHVLGFSGGFLPFTEVMTWKDGGVPIDWYSGWLATGTSTQMVGWFLNTKQTGGTQAAPSCRMFTTAYGYTSNSPLAIIDGRTSFLCNTVNVQDEVLAAMTIGFNDGAVGFVYDASVGNFGEVTFISQI